MRYNPYGLLYSFTNRTSSAKLSTVKKLAEKDPVRVLAMVIVVLSINSMLVWVHPQTKREAPCRMCMLNEWYPRVGEVSGLTALPEVTGIVTSSLARLYGTNDLR